LALKHVGAEAEPVDWRALRARVVAAWRRDPRNPVLLRALGLAKLMEGNRAKALRYLRQATRVAPRDAATWLALALAVRDPHQQERLARRALEARPGMPAARLVLAWALEAQGKSALAVPLYEAVLAAYPQHRAALRGLGRLLMDQSQTRDRAGRLLARLLKLDPGDQASRFNLALVRLAQKRFAEALRLVETLLAADPNDAAAHNLKGLALAGLGRLHQARSAYQAALKADPEHVPALYNLGVLCATRLKDTPCARQAFRRFLELEPKGKRAEKVQAWLVRHGG
jgi:tetratricopeptide (TPR) repeat protein